MGTDGRWDRGICGAISLGLLAACSSGDARGPAPSAAVGAPPPIAAPTPEPSGTPPAAEKPPDPRPAYAYFGASHFGTIRGLAYSWGAHAGVTDASGLLAWLPGETVTFHIGDVVLGEVKLDGSASSAILTPYAIAGSATCDETDDVAKIVALLETLDTDADPSNGIDLPSIPLTPGAAPRAISKMSWAEIETFAKRALPTPKDAIAIFIRAFDAESWTTSAHDDFNGFDALVRGQGIATDGSATWFFSGTTGLERTDTSFGTAMKNTIAIPPDLLIAGSDHIGDIDFWNDTLYAPIEDKGYKQPYVVLYDAKTLNAGARFAIAASLQPQGVPWIAVDGPRGVAYMADWDPTPSIHVFSLSDMSYLRAIELSRPLARIQGGKVHRGQLYLSADDGTKGIYKVHLATGTVLDIGALGVAGVEQEGLAFFQTTTTLLHTLNVNAAKNGVELHHWSADLLPARWSACP